jgi:hypothetical protein
VLHDEVPCGSLANILFRLWIIDDAANDHSNNDFLEVKIKVGILKSYVVRRRGGK